MSRLKILREKIKIFLVQTALHLEGIHLDAIQTKDILDKSSSECFEVDEDDAIVIRNIIDTLNYLENIDISKQLIDIGLYVKLNEILACEQALETGHLRTKPVFLPCIPDEIPPCDKNNVAHEIERIANANEDDFRNVIPDAFCKLARMQPFFDGNKRSTAFLCNVAMIKNNLGLLVISIGNLARFESLLTEYYTGENKDVLDFMRNKLIISTEQIEKEEAFILDEKS